MHGPHELHVGPAVGELVAHHLGNRQLRDRVVERALADQRPASRPWTTCRGTAHVPCRLHLRTGGQGRPCIGQAIDEASRPSLASALLSAGVGLPHASSATDTGITLCALLLGRRRVAWHCADMRRQTARRRESGDHGVLIGQASRLQAREQRLPQTRRRAASSAFGGSSSTSSSTNRLRVVDITPPSWPAAAKVSSAHALRRHRKLPAARGCRDSSAPRRAPGCGCGRCRPRAR